MIDPTQALANLLRACAQGDRSTALDASEALTNWLLYGGLPPDPYEAIDCANLNLGDPQ